MNRLAPIRPLLILSLLGASLSSTAAEPKPRSSPSASPLLLAHYMAWYEARPVSPIWGWHWTMNRFNPEIVKEDRRQIASHDYPSIGPYDSSDPDVLEYHALLMKIAGIDGAIIDWYGTTDFRDYAIIHRNTVKWIETLKRFGLRFAVCYEDQAVKHMVEAGVLPKEKALDRGLEHLRWLDTHLFRESLYAKWEDQPLLLVFGPQHFRTEDWKTLLGKLSKSPAFFTLDHRRDPALGAFAWLPMWKSPGKTLTPAMLTEYLNDFYADPEVKIGVAFPGFHDIYGEAGVRPSYGFLDREKGSVFKHTLERALKSSSPVVQIATWNDFGEGTTVEPTREYGYRYLEILQDAARRRKRSRFPYRASDLRLPLRIYHLRKQSESEPVRRSLDQAVSWIRAGRMDRARRLLSRLQAPPSAQPKRRAKKPSQRLP